MQQYRKLEPEIKELDEKMAATATWDHGHGDGRSADGACNFVGRQCVPVSCGSCFSAPGRAGQQSAQKVWCKRTLRGCREMPCVSLCAIRPHNTHTNIRTYCTYAGSKKESLALEEKREALDAKIAKAKAEWRRVQDKVDAKNKEMVNGKIYRMNKDNGLGGSDHFVPAGQAHKQLAGGGYGHQYSIVDWLSGDRR